MSGLLPIAFASPGLLFGLLALPVIWWLLRLTPPRPRSEPFAPLSILARVLKVEETPARSPWWLTALRLMVAALVILALAGPVLNPRDRSLASGGPLVLVIDNGWASANDWDARLEVAAGLITDAENASLPVSITFTANRRHDPTPGTAARAREQLLAAQPRALRPDRESAIAAVMQALGKSVPGTIAFLSDGIAAPGDGNAMTLLSGLQPAEMRIFEAGDIQSIALLGADNGTDVLSVKATRLGRDLPARISISAFDARGHEVAAGTIGFKPGEALAVGSIEAPFELRNDIARIAVAGQSDAGGTWLVDDSFRRRRVALVSGHASDLAQPLLSPLYYIDRALSPFADLIEADSADLATALPGLIRRGPAVIALADIGIMPAEASQALASWIEQGGTLIRFAGPRLAAAPAGDPLLPVLLRKGERELGGALSWMEPQPLADYPAASPFAGLPPPRDVKVSRQVLAEPSADLAAMTWASLADGTPLVTAAPRGKGRIVLFHVTAEAGWSNLPISGHFVDMLRRVVQLSRTVAATGGGETATQAGAAILPPWRLLDARGGLVPVTGDARPLDLTAGKMPQAGFDNPPGLYGNEDGFVALNLFGPDDRLEPLGDPEAGMPVTHARIAGDNALEIKPWLLAAALFGLAADTLAVLFLGGAMGRPRIKASSAAILLVLAVGLLETAPKLHARDSQPEDAEYLARLDRTHLAYVITGDDELDRTSRHGLDGLSRVLAQRTALEPGDAIGVDIETDQLAVFPLIYWPMSESAPVPSAAAVSRIDAYMKSGGSVLFDTRDHVFELAGGASPLTRRLQAILADLDIPALEPVPADHVLARSFYLISTFPGRYADGPLWVEALARTAEAGGKTSSTGDGVSSILITGNDFAAAWATDETGNPLFPTVPADPWQREFAYRAGVNIVMYMLTGNYKADQVHIPTLLERLGQ